MKKLTKLVFTGGPCAGKSTAIAFIRENLIKQGYTAIVMQETATELYSSGLSPKKMYSVLNFQQILFNIQMAKENYFEQACLNFNDSEHIVLIFDRGLLDGKVYLGNEKFAELLKIENITEKEIYDRYDAVFKLVTSANGAKEYYSLKSNAIRRETPEEAIVLDNKMTEVWQNHPNFIEIDNSTGFEQKLERLLDKILTFLKNY